MYQCDKIEPEEWPRSIFIIADRDISIVQGSTEMYYLSSFFSSISNTHLFAPTTSQITDAHMHSKPFSGLSGTILLNLVYFPYWSVMLAFYRPDVVYCYQNTITPAWIASCIPNTRVVYDIRSDPIKQALEFNENGNRLSVKKTIFSLSKLLHQISFYLSDLVVTLSDPLKEVLVKDYNVDSKKIHLLPLGVDTQKFNSESTIGNDLKLVYIGTIQERRGIDTVVDGIVRLSGKEQECIQLDLYGGADEKYVRKLEERVENEGKFHFNWHGRVPHEDIPNALSKADLALSPLPELEAYRVSSPAKIFEYLAAGVPVLASDIDAHTSILNEKCAFIVSHQPSKYSEVIAEVVNNPSSLSNKSHSAREEAMKHDWSHRFDELLDRLKSIR